MFDAAAAQGRTVTLEGVGQRFGETVVLRGVNLAVAASETVALLGPSGCGKTTLLRLLAGLAAPTEGRVTLGETVVACAATGRFVQPEARGLGMVFQDYALWPHMSVAGNVAFPLEMRGAPRPERAARVAEALALVGLSHLADRQPGTLSGGQQQRVALARAVVARPSVLLFDEPLSNLDRELREALVVDIAALVRRLGLTAVYVTHDHAEAFAMADRVAVLQGGRLLQADAPEALVAAPASAAVAAFLKLGLVAEGHAADGRLLLDGGALALTPPPGFAPEGPGAFYAPRRALALGGDAARATVLRCQFRGESYAAHLRLSPGLTIELPAPARLPDGAETGLGVDWAQARWFPAPATSPRR
jgi:iron(III) transport system ATP-binding protein